MPSIGTRWIPTTMYGCSPVMIEPISSSQAVAITKSGEADDAEVRFQALETWTRNLIPAAQNVTHRWSGQVLDTIDYAGFIGRNPGSNKIYVHTGDSGQGMTHGVVGAMINSGLILGRETKWADVYEPSRKTPAAIGKFLRENVTAVKNFAEYLAPGELAESRTWRHHPAGYEQDRSLS
jgi:hypothetical protein